MSRCLIQHQDSLIFDLTPPELDWDQFIAWSTNFLQRLQLDNIKPTDSGADQHMVCFSFAHCLFNLHYESYSNSLWISCAEPAAEQQLATLAARIEQLFEQTQLRF